MPCPHRYLGLHLDGQLFPNWEIEHLFIGTFNPIWDRPDAINAAYFYGRSAYFWDTVSIFFEDRPYAYDRVDRQAMIDFCQLHKIGFTDLIRCVEDADQDNPRHREQIYSVRDDELERFQTIDWNTKAIEDFLGQKRPKNVYFTLLSTNRQSIFSAEMRKIELKAALLKINCRRLHSPTGARLGCGVPRLHQLVERWSMSAGLPRIDLTRYPYAFGNGTTKKKDGPKKANLKAASLIKAEEEILVMNRYGLSIEPGGKVVLTDNMTKEVLKAKTVIRDIIIPYIRVKYRIEIGLNYTSKNRSPKNTRDLGQEVFQSLRQLGNATKSC